MRAAEAEHQLGIATTPDPARAKSLHGNRRRVDAKSDSGDVKIDPEAFAAIIRCADGRVALEIRFDQTCGGLFWLMVVGNVATNEETAGLEQRSPHSASGRSS